MIGIIQAPRCKEIKRRFCDMKDYVKRLVIAQGANDIFLPIGFCPDTIRITEYATGLEILWHRDSGIDQSITIVAAGDKTVSTDKGIKLCAFDPALDLNGNYTADPTPFSDANPVEDGKAANGIHLTADCVGLTDHAILVVEAWRSDFTLVRGVHDGDTNNACYFQDASVDFAENGISGGQKFILINKSNNNYAHIGDVIKPEGQTRYCRLLLTDAAGNAMAAADIDTGDVALIMPKAWAQYPLSDYGHMT